MVKRAVLIGIDEYADPGIPDLRGCVNDVKAMAGLLVDCYGFDAGHVTELVSAPGNTRDGIFAGLEGLIEATEQGDVAVVYYSGHGSQVPDADGDESDSLDETIVPSDSGRGNLPVRDILDDELHSYIVALSQRTPLCTFVFDSCHSGSVDRDLLTFAAARAARAASGPVARAIAPAKSRPQAPLRIYPGVGELSGAPKSASGLIPQGDYLLIAGCRDEETSAEMDFEGTADGALTHFLAKELREGAGSTVQKLFDLVATEVNREVNGQHPVLEGPPELKSAHPFAPRLASSESAP